MFPSLMPLKPIISSASQVWGNSSLVGDISSVWHFTRSGRRPALPQGVHSLVHTEPTCFRYNLWGHGSMRSLPPCDLQLYILINYFYLKGSFEKERKKKKRLMMILSVLVFGFGTNHVLSVIKHSWFPSSSSTGGRTWQTTREDKMTDNSLQLN